MKFDEISKINRQGRHKKSLDTNIQFERVKKVRLSDTVIDQIITLIKNGTLKIGDQLPSERGLVDQMQVARASVREALRILEFQGVIEVQSGKGAFIVGSVDNLYSGEEGVRQWFREHATEIKDNFELRDALEGRAARLAAIHILPDEIQNIKKTVTQAVTSIPDGNWDRIIQADRLFHHLVGVYSGNQLLSRLVDITYEVFGGPKHSLLQIPGRAEVSLQQHQAILDAIASGDPDASEKSMVDHITNVREAIDSLIE